MLRTSFVIALTSAALMLTACKGDPAKPEYWGKAITDATKTKDRVKVVEELRGSPNLNQTFLPMLHEQLAAEKKAEVKQHLAMVLAGLKDPSSVQPLADAVELGETDTASNGMNKEIAHALAEIGDPKAVPTLIRLLKSRDNYTKIEAINALGVLRAKEAVAPLVEFATSENGEPFISKKAIQALGNIGDTQAIPALVRMMFKERRGVSFYMESSFALFQLGGPAAKALLPVATGEDKELLAWAKENSIIEPALLAKTSQVLGDLNAHEAEAALLKQLKYDSEYLDLKLFVRMKAADALGRMRAKAAVAPLSAMLTEEEATARTEYIRSLVRIGDPAAIPALVKAAQKGSWDAREPAIVGIAVLGGEAELATLDKLANDEAALHAAYCKEDPDYLRCKNSEASVKSQVEKIRAHQKRVAAAKECGKDLSCWAKKLDDADAGVRERAAWEIGRSGDAKYVDVLVKRLSDRNLETRMAAITAADWLTTDSADAFKTAKASLTQIQKQLDDEKSKTEFVKVNEDLKRLAVKLARGA